jgi:hypothetical protein
MSENNSDINYVLKIIIFIFTNVSYEHFKMGQIQISSTRGGETWEQLSPNTDCVLLLHIYA